MTVSAHNSRRQPDRARRAVLPGITNRVYVPKPRRVDWLNCPAPMFLALLEEHERGEINLHTMLPPDDPDAELDDTAIGDMQDDGEEEPVTVSGRTTGNAISDRVVRLLRTATVPLSVSQIAEALGIAASQAKSALYHAKGRVRRVEDGRKMDKLWTAK